MDDQSSPVWSRPLADLLRSLGTDAERGLAAAEASGRLARDGRNTLPRRGKAPWWLLLLRQFASPLVYILVIAAGITLFLQERVDAVMIAIAVAVSVGVGFWQEYRAGDILESLRRVVRIRARVIRDGKTLEIDSEELVAGDVITLFGGIKVPADARLIHARNLLVDEALLTGESVPVEKRTDVVGPETPLADRTDMVFMGTVVGRGEGTAVVTSTGLRTAIGEVAVLTKEAEGGSTPLQERLARLGKLLTALVMIAGAIIVAVGLLERHTLSEMFTTAVAVAIASIPEGLPAALSIVLAVAMQRVLRHRGLVQSLVASETLGSVSVICTDKTGTLTEGRMKVERVVPMGNEGRLYEAMALANEVVAVQDGAVSGDPTDVAKMEAFRGHGGDLSSLLRATPRIAMLRFDSARKFLTSVHRTGESMERLYVAGAPEVLLDRSASVDTGRRVAVLRQVEEFAKDGFRVIALGVREMPADHGSHRRSDDELDAATSAIEFLGLVALRDPIRRDVYETMRLVRQAGVRVVMITGDHRLTASAIGRELGFSVTDRSVVEGTELDAMSDDELDRRIEEIEVLARVTPQNKIRIVQAWKRKGASVAMSGDGVNDAPALSAADIGVAVGSATDVTKTAADLVLLDNSFSTIVYAIREGRIAFDNIRKITIFLVADALTEVILVMAALVARVPIPLAAVQILWINFVKDVPPALALAFEPGEADIMRRKPVPRGAEVLDRAGRSLVFGIGAVSNAALLGLYLFFLFFRDFPLEYLRTIVFAGVGANALYYVFALKNLHRSIFTTSLLNNRALLWASAAGIALLLLAIYTGAAHRYLGTQSLTVGHALLLMVAFPLLQLFLIDGIKRFARR